MATQKKLEEALAALLPIMDQISEFENKYGPLLQEYRLINRELTEEDRNEAAIKLLSKYSNI